ncbi:MAG: MlaA family lipoprotein [Henriciella sp.]|nr:VacJ family lipoprotein [Hyphomonadaceae bacterium]
MRLALVLTGSVLALSACATTGEEQASGAVYDPFEDWNRGVYAFNDGVDRAVLEPVAKGYRAVTNEPVRDGVSNFLTNLNQPVVFANTVLQGKPLASLDTATRFFLNSTVGVAGIFDVATTLEVPEHREDFGQTLGTWGVPNGPYIVLPFLGSSNLRDTVGFGVDNAFDPLNYAQFEGDTAFRVTRQVAGVISVRENLIEAVEVLRDQPEPYVALRRNYTQQRAAAIRDGREQEDPFEDLPEFDDYDFGDEEEFESQE